MAFDLRGMGETSPLVAKQENVRKSLILGTISRKPFWPFI